MNADTQLFFVTGAAGKLECALDLPKADPSGIVLIAHPHPLYGGTMSNKVVQMIARTFVALGYIAVRMNFRGVGASEGSHDFGNGETDDMAVLLDHIKKQYPWRFFIWNLRPVQIATETRSGRPTTGTNGICKCHSRKVGRRFRSCRYIADSWRTG